MLNFIKRYWPTTLAALILLTALTSVHAKYVTERSLTGTLTVTANIGQIQVLEHEAIKQDNGSYVLNGVTNGACDVDVAHDHVTGNTYNTVIPGLDIPKDPHVVISGVTADIPVYVFIQVENDTLPDAMTYKLSNVWVELDSAEYPGVYVYSDTNGPIQVTSDQTIYILENDANAVITVSQELPHYGVPEGGWKLTFSACMAQTAAGTPAVAYAGIP